jgi:hypothetical protein
LKKVEYFEKYSAGGLNGIILDMVISA